MRGSVKQSFFIFEGHQIYLEVENQQSFDSESPDSYDEWDQLLM